ncbi:WecB/TagA/CpsF family glycosyltransferase [Mucilaginibacter sp. FT3.2]|uniref:WecB/TagA/CpsF family glycosyltransferase n=1 Tax=Mucilaginibacter sp. FT3.2 TaxID=2723090 RepID=UPI001620A260|nr:WecB/TagA/CpsF family glycosyltransferase [Mucilaginibacter sp. FT3.2]MBB6234170.1 N-acetylglucosaminyldiphosphoundecaprenol N-acetyl-beta-D-mannosaminyltransferase [Mucilaginibacter sp. FT3.2]
MDLYKIFSSKIPVALSDFDPRNRKLITFLNPNSYVLASERGDLFENFDWIAPDGILLVFTLNLLRATKYKIRRFSCDMTSIVPYVFNVAIENKLSVFFLGADADSLNQSVNVFKNNFKELNIIGYRNGYFTDITERQSIINNIVYLNPAIVFVGMGVILQETMALDLKKSGFRGAIYTCGGFLHQTKREINFYPTFIDKLNLRFFYRVFKEDGFFKRSIRTYPMFCYLMILRGIHKL